MLTWKFIIHDLLYNRGQSEHYVMDASKTNKRALRRYITRIHATLRELQLRILRDTPKGRTVNIKGINTKLSPVAKISEGGRDIQWEGNMGRYLQAARCQNNNKPYLLPPSLAFTYGTAEPVL